MRGLEYQPLVVPFTSGLDQKRGDLFRQPPTLDICKDVEFDDAGELALRKPYAAMGADTSTGGTLSTFRRIVANGNELLAFTKDALYSWDATAEEWVSKGTHLAVKVGESPVFTNTADQVQCDRAELAGVVFYSWTETVDHAGSTVDVAYVAAVDKETGSVVMPPRGLTISGAAGAAVRTRLVALSTRVLLFFLTASNSGLFVYSMDPADPTAAFASATTVLAVASMNTYYDAVKVPGADTAVVACRRVTTTSYSIITVTAALSVTPSTKARTCDGPIAVSCPSTGTHVQVIRADGTNIVGDYIALSGLADVTTGQAIGTGIIEVSQIAAAHRSVQNSGQYRCYAFWSSSENAGASPGNIKFNYVDTGGGIGTQATFIDVLGIASRAFDRDGSVFVNLIFSSAAVTGASLADRAQLQDTYFLYRDDQLLVAKQVASAAGGFESRGRLPGVQSLGSDIYAWCGQQRRVITLGGTDHSGYACRGPKDISLEFDSDHARRTARLGNTLYIAGGEILGYDGTQTAEIGFHTYPWYFVLSASGAAGDMENGAYTYKATWRWDNGRADRDRSTTATAIQETIVGGPGHMDVDGMLHVVATHKVGIVAEVWRTQKDPTVDADFYLASSQDPSDGTNPNRHLPVPAPTSSSTVPLLSDELSDDDITGNEAFSEVGDVLENLAPPAASIITATDTRLFLAGVAGDPDRVWYSKLRNDGDVAAFHDALTIAIPRQGGDITALAFLNETLIVFREHAVYALPGDGFSNVGGADGSQNYGPARCLSSDLGALSHEAVALTPAGLVFKSAKGWYLLDRGWQCQYIGGLVRDYDSEEVVAVDVVESQHQVRVLTGSRMLVLDYLVNQWGEWTVSGIDAAMWMGTHLTLGESDGPYQQQSDYTTTGYGYDVETAWIKPSGPSGDVRVRWFLALGEYLSSHHVRVRVARDYEQDGSGNVSYFDDAYWTPSPTTVGGGLQVRHSPSRQNLTAIKIRLTAVNASNHATTPASGALAKLAALSVEFGLKRPLNRRLPSAQRQ